MSRNFELLCRVGKELPEFSSDLLPNEGQSHQVDETVSVEEEGVKSEKENVLFRRVPNDSPLRDGEGCEQAQNELVKLVQRVFMFPNSGAPRLVVFSSIDKRSGSSEICFGVGDVLAAQVSGSVCMVDANLRSPSLHELLGIGRSPGLTDAMISLDPIKDFAVPIARGNLWLMPPGSSAGEATGLFASDRWCSRLAELKEEFDYVLIDAPSASMYMDPILLGQKADGVILIVEANSTRRETTRMAKQTFEGAGILH